jgi:hypothetical protein
MIIIKKTSCADSRCATKKVSKKELLSDSLLHIKAVRDIMDWMACKTRRAGFLHDWTKVVHINDFYRSFSAKQRGDPRDFSKMYWYKEMHLTQERHHLDNRVPEDVNLFDVLERAADIVAAGLARSGQVYDDTLSPDVLAKAYKNTIDLLKKNVYAE